MAKETEVITHSTHDVETAISEAVQFLPKHFTPKHTHSKRCFRVLEHILYKDEYTVIEAKQSLFRSLAPVRIVATNQRIIVVNPSFSSLWLGHNILTPTRYEVIPYANVANITLLAGISFSSISIYLTTGAPNWNGTIEGLKTSDAKAMFVFLEKMTEALRKQQGKQTVVANTRSSKKMRNEVSLKVSKDLVKHKGSRFVWLGVHPLEYAADTLGTDKEAITRLDIGEVAKMDRADASRFEGCIFVCYNGIFSSYVSDYIWEKHGVNTYVLDGGIEHHMKESK